MALHSMPILYFNLCGEMMYVLEQRLKAQSIPQEKTQKVLADIIATMLGKKFVAELFQAQETFTRGGFYTLFSKIAHTSIMRLNTTSMDRLFDLMIMAVKQQIVGCIDPTEILYITFNHLDGLRAMIFSKTVLELITYAHASFVSYYSPMTYGEIAHLRQGLLSYFQDVNIKVALFLREGVQLNNGKFALPLSYQYSDPFQKPGMIRNLKTGESANFPAPDDLEEKKRTRSTGIGEPRGTKLGLNMYNPDNGVFSDRKQTVKAANKAASPDDEFAFAARSGSSHSQPSSNEVSLDSQLNMMLKLLGTKDSTNSDTNKLVKLNLFDSSRDDEWMNSAESQAVSNEANRIKTITLDASKQKRPAELQQVIDGFSSSSSKPNPSRSTGEDLLELLDSSI